MYDLVFNHSNLTVKDIENLKNEAYQKCYLSISWLKKYFNLKASLPH